MINRLVSRPKSRTIGTTKATLLNDVPTIESFEKKPLIGQEEQAKTDNCDEKT